MNYYFKTDILKRFKNNENSLREIYKTTEKIKEVEKQYNEQLIRFEENIKTEINKYPIFRELFNEIMKNSNKIS